MKEKRISVAIDLCRDYSQIAYYIEGMQDCESVSTIPGEERFLIPMVLAKQCRWEEWYIGEVAMQYMQNDLAVGVTDLLDLVVQKQVVELEGTSYQAVKLLQLYLEKLLQNLPIKTGLQDLVITMEHQTVELINDLYQIFQQLGISREQITIMEHSESFIYYTLFQKRELWANEVILFHFSKYAFTMKRLRLVRSVKAPVPVIVEETDYSDRITYAMLQTAEGKAGIDAIFRTIVETISAEWMISTIYLTGCGFYENWMDTAMTPLCKKHRVFMGYNLFIKGGCYAKMDKVAKENYQKYQFICPGRTLLDIDLEVIQEHTRKYLRISNAGTNWYKAGARVECILDGTKQINIRITSMITKETKEETISLDNFPDRPDRMTRIELSFTYENTQTCIFYIKDKGFGAFYPASDQYVRKELWVQDFID